MPGLYFLISVLSHGELGILYASDQPYKPDTLQCRQVQDSGGEAEDVLNSGENT